MCWQGQSPQATLRSPVVMKVRLFKPCHDRAKSAGNAALACGYEGSAFQAAVLNTLTFSPNG
ncbi:MAG: hypothetical protein LBG92_07105 [Prevotellaceae bacterium]|nr:hypothetical protein [Prevotellaceae bacterium]